MRNVTLVFTVVLKTTFSASLPLKGVTGKWKISYSMLDFRFGGFMPPDKSELGSFRFGGRVPDRDLLRLKSVYVCIRYTPP